MRTFRFFLGWALLAACHPIDQAPRADESIETCPTLLLTPDDLLIHGEFGEEELASFDLTNPCTDVPLVLAGIALTDDDDAFEILYPDLDGLVLEPGETVDLLVAFTAQHDEIHLADVELWIEGQDEPATRNLVLGIVPTGSRSGAAPTADAGAAETLELGATALLDASGSSDPEGDSLSVLWTFQSVAGGSGLSNSSISDPTSMSASFVPDVAGTYRVRLVISDGTSTAKDFTNVTATSGSNSAPIADAGASQTVTLGSVATADGTGSSDPDGDPITTAWTLHVSPGSSSLTTADLSGASTTTPSFTPDVTGTYRLKLMVSDGAVQSKDFTTIVVSSGSNTTPIADAGANQVVTTSSTVTLDGTGSSDADGDALTYSWTLLVVPGGSSLGSSDITDATSATSSFVPDVEGSFRIKLLVNDGVENAKDFVTIVVSDPNTAPDADAGADQSVATGSTVTLDGTATSDAEGDALTYSWSLHVLPGGSSLTSSDITNATSATASFVPDVDGSFRLKLLVSDGTENAKDFLTVTASADADGDGFTVGDGDCDDGDLAVYPGATEVCDDSVDNNCSGTVDLTPVEEDGVKLYTFFMWFDAHCYNTPGGGSLSDSCTYSEDVALTSSSGFTVTPVCELSGPPHPGDLTVDAVVDADGQITFTLTAADAPIDHATSGEMCDGTAYQWGDPYGLWGGTAKYGYNPPADPHWTYTCYNSWYFMLGPA